MPGLLNATDRYDKVVPPQITIELTAKDKLYAFFRTRLIITTLTTKNMMNVGRKHKSMIANNVQSGPIVMRNLSS